MDNGYKVLDRLLDIWEAGRDTYECLCMTGQYHSSHYGRPEGLVNKFVDEARIVYLHTISKFWKPVSQ